MKQFNKKTLIICIIIAIMFTVGCATKQQPQNKAYVQNTNDEWVIVNIDDVGDREYIPLSDTCISEIVKKEFEREMDIKAVNTMLVWEETDNDKTYKTWIVITEEDDEARGWYMGATMLLDGTIKNFDVISEIQ